MMFRSPRCSDGAHVHLLTVTGARSANPLPKTRREHVPFTGVASAWDSHPHGRRCVSLKWDGTMLAERLRFHGLSSPVADSAS